ncbi:hypothetical protein CU254_41850 (plasmid) [Amycolatopsis sp. AA4]|uniref:hypothetical protein n=1 Tax=Actinomycetes TaxID=1760 RepID=UPI0001B5713E|nr:MULTISPECIES: hypothetical protein [Actinomycetes]ATY17124.1 hypothetical protein CU254_41850 [Amycolatopsis sp. AA4]
MSEYILAAERGVDLYAVWSGNDGAPVAVGTRAQIIDSQAARGALRHGIEHSLDIAAQLGSSNLRKVGFWNGEAIAADRNRALLPRDLVGDYLRAWLIGDRDRCAELLDYPGGPTARQAHADDESDEGDGEPSVFEPIVLSGPPTIISLPAAAVEADLRVLRGFREHGTINAIRPATDSGRAFIAQRAVTSPEIDLTTAAGLRLILRSDRDPYYPGYELWLITTAPGEPVRVGGTGTELIDDVQDLPLAETDVPRLESILDQLWTEVAAAWRVALTATAPTLADGFTAAARRA